MIVRSIEPTRLSIKLKSRSRLSRIAERRKYLNWQQPNPLTPFPVKEGGTEKYGGGAHAGEEVVRIKLNFPGQAASPDATCPGTSQGLLAKYRRHLCAELRRALRGDGV